MRKQSIQNNLLWHYHCSLSTKSSKYENPHLLRAEKYQDNNLNCFVGIYTCWFTRKWYLRHERNPFNCRWDSNNSNDICSERNKLINSNQTKYFLILFDFFGLRLWFRNEVTCSCYSNTSKKIRNSSNLFQ